jgi:protein-L-isoaspartate(D-aspartate) O-methyltransferase
MVDERKEMAEARAVMVTEQLSERYIGDSRVLGAMGAIPRHRFVDKAYWDSAYEDGPIPIGYNQTISQPFIVAFMTQALCLSPNSHPIVLEIGTGSGYQAAVLSQLAAKVYSDERIEPLANRAKRIFDVLNIRNVEIKIGDGGYGWPEYGPYDGIIVTAAAPEIPAPLTVQLKNGARLVAPIGPKKQQQLLRLQRRDDEIVKEKLVPVAFVPLLGEHGWAE